VLLVLTGHYFNKSALQNQITQLLYLKTMLWYLEI